MDSNRQNARVPAVGRTICQLQCAPDATIALRADERLAMRVDKTIRRALIRARKVLSHPGVLLEKAFSNHDTPRPTAALGATIPLRHTPPLTPGDRVRVRSLAEIEATLDAAGTCDGMSFLGIVMEKYCGGTFTVKRRIDRFFDERNWKMLKLRDAVILDGSFCEPPKAAGVDWAGCDRSCFLFWKEAWLERIDGNIDGGIDGDEDHA